MTIIETLKDEHKVVMAMLKELEGTTDRAEKTRAELRAKIEKALVGHAKGEEAVVYPAYAARGGAKDSHWRLVSPVSQRHQ